MTYSDPDGRIIQKINLYKAEVQRQWAAKNVQLGQNTAVRRNGTIPYNLYDYGCFVTSVTNILNTFKHDKYNSNPNKIYTIFQSNDIKSAFFANDGNLLGPNGIGALRILGQNDYVKSLGIEYSRESASNLSAFANDPNNLYLIIGEEELNGGSHFFNILSGPDANGNIKTFDGWQEGSPYVTKNVDDLLSIRVFKIPNKELLEQIMQMNTQGKNPNKTYLEQGK